MAATPQAPRRACHRRPAGTVGVLWFVLTLVLGTTAFLLLVAGGRITSAPGVRLALEIHRIRARERRRV